MNNLEKWTKSWCLTINEKKTTHTVYSLSNSVTKPTLKLTKSNLHKDPKPTYLGATLDRRLTWRAQIKKKKTVQNAKQRMNLVKKLPGSTWVANGNTLKKLYTGMVRPVLEYGIAAWATASNTQFYKINKVRNYAARIITGAMKSTPTNTLETMTGLQPMEDRRDSKVIQTIKCTPYVRENAWNRKKQT
jgi:thymidylate synthase